MKLTRRGYTVASSLALLVFLTLVGFTGWLENLGL